MLNNDFDKEKFFLGDDTTLEVIGNEMFMLNMEYLIILFGSQTQVKFTLCV